MVSNSFQSYFMFTFILFLNLINVSLAGIGGISAAAAGGAMSVLKGKGGFGPRPRDEDKEALIIWVLVGCAGVALLVVACSIMRTCRKEKTEDPENPKANLYTTKKHEDSLKCNLGIQKRTSIVILPEPNI